MKIVTEDIPQKLGHEIRFRSSFQAREEIAERQHIQGDQAVDLIVHRHLSINVKSVVDDLHIHMNHLPNTTPRNPIPFNSSCGHSEFRDCR